MDHMRISGTNVSISATTGIRQIKFNLQFHFFHNCFTHLTKISQSALLCGHASVKINKGHNSGILASYDAYNIMYYTYRIGIRILYKRVYLQQRCRVYQSFTYPLTVDRLQR